MVLLHFSDAINLRKIGIARREKFERRLPPIKTSVGAKDAEEEETGYAQCYACVKIRKSCMAD